MLKGIADVIIKQFIRPNKVGGLDRGLRGSTEGGPSEIASADMSPGFSLEELRIPGMSKEQEQHVEYLVKKLLKEDSQGDDDKEAREKRRKAIPLEIEKHMNRYLTEKEKELVGILINKLV